MPHRLDVPSSDRSGDVPMKADKQDLRYLGFECNNDGGREFDFSITTLGHVPKVVSVEVPGFFFVGQNESRSKKVRAFVMRSSNNCSLTSQQARTELEFGCLLTM